jgi:hypothetical protein
VRHVQGSGTNAASDILAGSDAGSDAGSNSCADTGADSADAVQGMVQRGI